MLIETKNLIGALKATTMFASTDEPREHLNCVRLEAVGSALRLVATDGHTMWCCEVPTRDAAEDPAPAHQTPWNLSLADAFIALRRLEKSELGEVSLLLAKRELDGHAYKHLDKDFAPYHIVIPSLDSLESKDSKRVLPEFAASYIARACEALRLYSKGFAPAVLKKCSKSEREAAQVQREGYLDPPIAWRLGGELDPSVVYSPKFPAAFAVVMPRKGAGNNSIAIASFVERIKSTGSRAA